MQLAADAISHARAWAGIRVAVDDRQQLAAVFGCRQVFMVQGELVARRPGQVATRHVLTAGFGLDQYATRLGRVFAFRMLANRGLQLLVDAHGYLELAIRLAPIEPPKRRVLPRSLQLFQRPARRSSAGLSVGSFCLVNIAAPA